MWACDAGVSKMKTYENEAEDLRWVFGLRNYENKYLSLFSYYENEDHQDFRHWTPD
jgi:hypothetical protein